MDNGCKDIKQVAVRGNMKRKNTNTASMVFFVVICASLLPIH